MKQVLFALLLALFAAVMVVNAQSTISEEADNALTDFLKEVAKNSIKDYVNKNWDQEEESDLFLSPAIIRRLTKEPRYYILTDEELADKSWFKKALKVVGEIGKLAIKDYVNKNWDEIPEEEADIKFSKLFKAVLPYLKAGAKQYINNNWDQVEQADLKWDQIIGAVLPYIKTGVKDYVNNNWDEEADKGFWSSVWNVVKQVGKGAIKSYVNQNWDEEMELSDKFWSKVWKVVKEIGKGAIKSYVNQNFDEAADADIKFGKIFKKALSIAKKIGKAYISSQIGVPLADIEAEIQADFSLKKLWKKVAPYLKAGAKEYINNNFDEEADAEIKFGKIFKKALSIAKKLGKAYITSQTGIPLSDSESRNFFKKLGKLLKKSLPYLKEGVKQYVNNNWDEEADAELRFKDILRAALPYLKEGVKEYVNQNFDEEADQIDYEKLFQIALPLLRNGGVVARG